MSGYMLGQTEVADTFAEAFPMRYGRVMITAATDAWAQEAARSMTGFATSVIGCKCEAAIECRLGADDTPDGRRAGIHVEVGDGLDKLQRIEWRDEIFRNAATGELAI